MKSLVSLIFAFFITSQLLATNPLWIRSSAISPDGQKVVFVYKGDLYLAGTKGGDAVPITSNVQQEIKPVWSHDGSKLAFASNRYGNFDIFLTDFSGNEPIRLTYYSEDEYPYAFNADNSKVIFGGKRLSENLNRQYPTSYLPELYEISIKGGRVTLLYSGQAEDVSINDDGSLLFYHDKMGGENEFRKHHTSSVTRDIWAWNKESNTHTKISDFNGEDRSPVYSPSDKLVYFLSERSGVFNVYNMNQDGSNVKQLTSYKDFPVRYLSVTKNGTACYSYNGELYRLTAGSAPVKMTFNIKADSKMNNTSVLPISGSINEAVISTDGKQVAYIVRGEVFIAASEIKMSKRITNTASQERFLSFGHEGKSIIYASEREGKWGIYSSELKNSDEKFLFAGTEIVEKELVVNEHNNYEPQISPDGKKLAFIEDRDKLVVMDLATKAKKVVVSDDVLYNMGEGDQYFQWSPDNNWLLFSYSPVMANSEVGLIKADGSGKMINLTQNGYNDYQPRWAQDGNVIIWLSDRSGLKSYANSGRRELDAYAFYINQEAYDQFKLTKDEFELIKKIKEDSEDKPKIDDSDKDKKKKKSPEITPVKSLNIDLNNMEDRTERLTIHSSALADVLLSKEGDKLYYLARFESGVNLWSTHIRTKETKMELALNASNGGFLSSEDGKKIILLSNGQLSSLTLEPIKKESLFVANEMQLDVNAEREYMFNHVWQRTNSMFYISNFHGVDWKMQKENYQRFLPHIGTDYEFSEMLSEMLGELNVSHSGARFRGSMDGADKTASLGVFYDYSYTGKGLKVTEVLEGGPLDKDNISIQPGMIITHLNGVSLDESIDVAFYLNRLENTWVSIQVTNADLSQPKRFSLKPISLGEERQLLYKRWVKKNAEEVSRLSDGKLGYVHIPSMSDGPYRTTYEQVMGKYHDADGIVVDTRFNGGGDLVSDLAMFFTGSKYIEYATEQRAVGYEPGFRWTKPTVAMVNEANYSDGHCFACGYQELGIGKLIGMPVPGTCSFAGWEMLQNGTVLWGAVPVSAKNSKGEWMENNQTVPEIMVKNYPWELSKGNDPQLEAAVNALKQE